MDTKPFTYNFIKVDYGYNLMVKRERFYKVLGIFLKDGTPIGDISFRNLSSETRSGTIGIALGTEEYKGKGLGMESFGLGLQYAFCSLQLQLIYGDTLSSNIRMQKIFESYRFIHYETIKHFARCGHIWEDRYNYVLKNPY